MVDNGLTHPHKLAKALHDQPAGPPHILQGQRLQPTIPLILPIRQLKSVAHWHSVLVQHVGPVCGFLVLVDREHALAVAE